MNDKISKRTSDKKKMNTYIKFILIVLASGIVGGIFGATSAVGEDAGVNAAIAVDIKNFFYFVRSNALVLELVCGVISIAFCEFYIADMRKVGRLIEVATDDMIDDLQYHMEVDGSWGVTASTAGTILMILIIAPGYSLDYIKSQTAAETWIYLVELIIFIVMVAYLNIWQIRYVKLIQKVYPDKKGDPTSMKFQEQWLASCDEAEKECVYQASYKTYALLGKCLPAFTLAAMILHMVWNTGILAIVIPAILWLLTSVNYCHYCVVKKGENLNK